MVSVGSLGSGELADPTATVIVARELCEPLIVHVDLTENCQPAGVCCHTPASKASSRYVAYLVSHWKRSSQTPIDSPVLG